MLNMTDPHKAFDYFMTKFSKIFSKCLPIIEQKSLFTNPWFDNELHSLLQKKQHFLKTI